jgi:hypothetical protein
MFATRSFDSNNLLMNPRCQGCDTFLSCLRATMNDLGGWLSSLTEIL